jgi:hypothetical protein
VLKAVHSPRRDKLRRDSDLVKELLELVEARTERPAHAFAGIDCRRGLSERKLEPGNRLDQITFLVVHDDRAALAPAAIGRFAYHRDKGSAAHRRGPRSRKYPVGDRIFAHERRLQPDETDADHKMTTGSRIVITLRRA